jgi:hypothetical protein
MEEASIMRQSAEPNIIPGPTSIILDDSDFDISYGGKDTTTPVKGSQMHENVDDGLFENTNDSEDASGNDTQGESPIVTDMVSNTIPQDVWTDADEEVLKDTRYEEVMLWRRFHQQFACVPPDVFPDGTWVEVGACRGMQGVRRGFGIFNHNWPVNFQVALTKLTCLPPFQKDPKAIKYAIELSRYYRLRTCSKPSSAVLHVEDDRNLDLRHESLYFVSKIKESCKQSQKRQKCEGIMERDLASILRAWDMWAAKNGYQSSERCRIEENSKRTDTTKMNLEALQRKKAWILTQQ